VCAACSSGYTLLDGASWYLDGSRSCERCGPNCQKCDAAGPGYCDMGGCAAGFFSSESLCLACAAGCSSCRGSGARECRACFWTHDLTEEGCVRNIARQVLWYSGVGLAVAMVAWFFFGARRRTSQRDLRASLLQTSLEEETGSDDGHRDYVTAGSGWGEARITFPPEGAWRGVYTQAAADHNVCEFTLRFVPGEETEEVGRVTGEGTDDVGHYRIRGKYHAPSQRVAFSKTYAAGSRNARGRVSRQNKGHRVEYRGAMQALATGLRGTWSIQSRLGNHSGRFHLWPVMEGWNTEQEDPAFVVDGECCVCFDAPIDTGLHPCGHFSTCRGCADRLRPRRCPICREDIVRYRERPSS